MLLFIPNLIIAEIHFLKSYEEAMEIAKLKQKPIFIDAMAYWCGPCKRMETDVFTDETIGTFFNANFVNVQIDAFIDKKFKNQFNISAYPTLLFLNPNGEIIQRRIGYLDTSQLYFVGKRIIGDDAYELRAVIDELKKQTDNTIYSFFEEQSQAGGNAYLNLLGNKYLSDTKINSEIQEKIFFSLFPNIDKQNIKTFVKNNDLSKISVGKQEKIAEAYLMAVQDAKETKEFLKYNDFPSYNKMAIYIENFSYSKFMSIGIFGKNEKLLNSNCNLLLFYPETNNKQLLWFALKYVLFMSENPYIIEEIKVNFEKIASQKQSIVFYDYLSMLQYKLGENDEALQSIRKGLLLSKKEKVRYKPSLSHFKKEIKIITY